MLKVNKRVKESATVDIPLEENAKVTMNGSTFIVKSVPTGGSQDASLVLKNIKDGSITVFNLFTKRARHFNSVGNAELSSPLLGVNIRAIDKGNEYPVSISRKRFGDCPLLVYTKPNEAEYAFQDAEVGDEVLITYAKREILPVAFAKKVSGTKGKLLSVGPECVVINALGYNYMFLSGSLKAVNDEKAIIIPSSAQWA